MSLKKNNRQAHQYLAFFLLGKAHSFLFIFHFFYLDLNAH
jgi:hypothetical protein